MSSAVHTMKHALRSDMKLRLKDMTAEAKRIKSVAICQKVLEHPAYQTSTRISLFLSMADEVDTTVILKDALAVGKLCFIPRYDSQRMEMVLLRSYDDYMQLPETKWKIKQPPLHDCSRPEAMQTGGLDLMLVPGLAFTVKGHRLGRGKGYYDNYLTSYVQALGRRPAAIGLAFKEQICDCIPVNDNDVCMEAVVTD